MHRGSSKPKFDNLGVLANFLLGGIYFFITVPDDFFPSSKWVDMHLSCAKGPILAL